MFKLGSKCFCWRFFRITYLLPIYLFFFFFLSIFLRFWGLQNLTVVCFRCQIQLERVRRAHTMNELNEAKRIGIRSVEIIIDKNGIETKEKERKTIIQSKSMGGNKKVSLIHKIRFYWKKFGDRILHSNEMEKGSEIYYCILALPHWKGSMV